MTIAISIKITTIHHLLLTIKDHILCFIYINLKCPRTSLCMGTSSFCCNITYDKVAYITIDDGPSKFTNQILDILDKNDVKATFFMINRNIKINFWEILYYYNKYIN